MAVSAERENAAGSACRYRERTPSERVWPSDALVESSRQCRGRPKRREATPTARLSPI